LLQRKNIYILEVDRQCPYGTNFLSAEFVLLRQQTVVGTTVLQLLEMRCSVWRDPIARDFVFLFRLCLWVLPDFKFVFVIDAGVFRLMARESKLKSGILLVRSGTGPSQAREFSKK